jgi:hypothetical protein
MKKNVFFIISVLIFGMVYSQVFKDAQDYTRTSLIDLSTEYLQEYSQKVLHYKDSIHIAMSNTVEGKTIFTKMTDGNIETAEYVVIDSFNVKDFDVFGDKLYFCGSKNNDVSTDAFIAYVDISDLFPPNDYIISNSSNIKYTLINNIYQDSIFSINRIEVFRDSNDVVIAGIGKMYYGKPPYEVMTPNQFDITFEFKDPSEYYLDFFMLYTIKEESVVTNQYDVDLGATPTYDIANNFEMFYIPTDTVNSCYYNKFADITETDNKIYLTAVDYSIISDSNYFTTNYIKLYSFDKLTRQQQTARINLSFSIYQDLGIKTTHLTGDDFAIALNQYRKVSGVYTQTPCVFKVSPDATNIFNLSNFSFFDSFKGRGFKIYDCDYLAKRQEVIVLKNSAINEQKYDVVLHLDMRPNVTYPYTSYKYKVNLKENSDYHIRMSDLCVSASHGYTVTGYFTDESMLIYDTRNESYLSNYPCFVKENLTVTNSAIYNIANNPPLEQCRFSRQVPMPGDGHLFILYLSDLVHHVFFNTLNFPNVYNSSIETSCFK